MRKLSEAADRLGHGDFSQRVPVTGHDEVSILADKFNKMANGLERMVLSGKELTAHLSHELRTPLTRMQISLQMAIEKSEEGTCDDSARYLSKIRCEIEKMDTIIGQILALSKLDPQEPQPRTDSVDMVERIQALLKPYGPMIEQRHFKIDKNLTRTPALLCNSNGLNLLLDNILSNAMKYTDEYGAIAVTTYMMDKAIHIEVCNTHPLLTEKDLNDIFIPFQRLYRSSETGTGLGLASAKK